MAAILFKTVERKKVWLQEIARNTRNNNTTFSRVFHCSFLLFIEFTQVLV